jgi:hypothetical protein
LIGKTPPDGLHDLLGRHLIIRYLAKNASDGTTCQPTPFDCLVMDAGHHHGTRTDDADNGRISQIRPTHRHVP